LSQVSSAAPGASSGVRYSSGCPDIFVAENCKQREGIYELWFMNYDVGNRSIVAEAERGGLEKMRNFLIGLPLLLGVIF
jgi:hypothetical protein